MLLVGRLLLEMESPRWAGGVGSGKSNGVAVSGPAAGISGFFLPNPIAADHLAVGRFDGLDQGYGLTEKRPIF